MGPFAVSAICCIAARKPRSSRKVISTSSKRIKGLTSLWLCAVPFSLQTNFAEAPMPSWGASSSEGITSTTSFSNSCDALQLGRDWGDFTIWMFCDSTGCPNDLKKKIPYHNRIDDHSITQGIMFNFWSFCYNSLKTMGYSWNTCMILQDSY